MKRAFQSKLKVARVSKSTDDFDGPSSASHTHMGHTEAEKESPLNPSIANQQLLNPHHNHKPEAILALQHTIGNRAVMRKLAALKTPAPNPAAQAGALQRMTGADVLADTKAPKKTGLNRTTQLQLDNLINKIRERGTNTPQQRQALQLYGELNDNYDQKKMKQLFALLKAIPDQDFVETTTNTGGNSENQAQEWAGVHGWSVVMGDTKMAASQTYKKGKQHGPKGRLYTDGSFFYSIDNTGHGDTDWKIYGGSQKNLDWRGGVSNDTPLVLIQRGEQRGKDVYGGINNTNTGQNVTNVDDDNEETN